jgi:hypothetical protein
MQPAVAFGEVLDEFLGDIAGRSSAEEPATKGWHPGIGTRPLFQFEGATSLRSTINHAKPRPRPARALSASQRQALDLLNSLGAQLTADFTRDELRSAFRALARRFHPDTNPTVSGREFAALRGAYDALR